jgi:hypothetical protein
MAFIPDKNYAERGQGGVNDRARGISGASRRELACNRRILLVLWASLTTP